MSERGRKEEGASELRQWRATAAGSERASEDGSSLRAGSMRIHCGMPRRGASGAPHARHCTLQANHAHCFSPPSMKSLPFYMVSDEVEKVCMGC